MNEDERNALTTHRIGQAKETVSEAELLIAHGKYRAAVNRIYYGMFYALSALGHACDFSTSRHGQLIGWFNKNFIKERVFDRKYGKMLREAFEIRNRGDYDAFVEFSRADVLRHFEEMKEFIDILEQYIEDMTRVPET